MPRPHKSYTGSLPDIAPGVSVSCTFNLPPDVAAFLYASALNNGEGIGAALVAMIRLGKTLGGMGVKDVLRVVPPVDAVEATQSTQPLSEAEVVVGAVERILLPIDLSLGAGSLEEYAEMQQANESALNSPTTTAE
jgi:hypothetical protein